MLLLKPLNQGLLFRLCPWTLVFSHFGFFILILVLSLASIIFWIVIVKRYDLLVSLFVDITGVFLFVDIIDILANYLRFTTVWVLLMGFRFYSGECGNFIEMIGLNIVFIICWVVGLFREVGQALLIIVWFGCIVAAYGFLYHHSIYGI